MTPALKAQYFHLLFVRIEHKPLFYLETRLSHLAILNHLYPPSFCFHALSVIVNTITNEAPPVETGGNCWVGMPRMLYCLAVGSCVYHAHTYSIYLVFLYTTLERKEITDVGLFVVPTWYTVE